MKLIQFALLPLVSLIITSVHGATYEWTFDSADYSAALGNGILSNADGATGGLVSFGTTNGTSVPHIGGVPGNYLSVPSFTGLTNGIHLTFPASGPNGGGAYMNDYTLIMDIFSPGSSGWQALFNSNTSNSNDADFYIDPSGKIGIGSLGYSADSVISQNSWNRIAFAADLNGGVVKYFVNGTLVHTRTGGALTDGRFALFTNADAGADLLLFNEGDSSGVYTHPLLVNSVAFADSTLSDSEIAALGGANAGGILVPEPGSTLLVVLSGMSLFARRRRA